MLSARQQEDPVDFRQQFFTDKYQSKKVDEIKILPGNNRSSPESYRKQKVVNVLQTTRAAVGHGHSPKLNGNKSLRSSPGLSSPSRMSHEDQETDSRTMASSLSNAVINQRQSGLNAEYRQTMKNEQRSRQSQRSGRKSTLIRTEEKNYDPGRISPNGRPKVTRIKLGKLLLLLFYTINLTTIINGIL